MGFLIPFSDDHAPKSEGATKSHHVIARGNAPHPRVASLALRAIHLLAIRSPSGSSGTGRCFASQGMRIATGCALAMTEVTRSWSYCLDRAVTPQKNALPFPGGRDAYSCSMSCFRVMPSKKSSIILPSFVHMARLWQLRSQAASQLTGLRSPSVSRRISPTV